MRKAWKIHGKSMENLWKIYGFYGGKPWKSHMILWGGSRGTYGGFVLIE
jgi:hypothetical protein